MAFRRPALDLSIAGLCYTFLLCLTLFRTPATVLLAAGADGILKTLPLLLVVVAGIALSTVLLASGSLQRIVRWCTGRAAADGRRAPLLSIGVGNFMEGAGVIAEPVLAPMLRAAGLSPTASAALSIQGYAGLMTLALGGIIVKVLATVTELPLVELEARVALLSALPTVLLSLAIPWVAEERGDGKAPYLVSAGSGAAAAIACWASVRYVGAAVSAMAGGLAVIALLGFGSRRGRESDARLLRDFAPFALIIGGLGLVSLVPPIRRFAYDAAIVATIVPGKPDALRPLFDAYSYIGAAIALSLVLFPFGPGRRTQLLADSLRKSLRPVLSMAFFGAMGQMIAYSGYAPGFSAVDDGRNLAWILARGTYDYTGSLYPLFAPLLGWVGTFLTGYGVASIMLFGKFQVAAAGLLGVSPVALASALAIGAGVGSISSPFKIALATPLCDAMGREGAILRKTVPLGIAVSLALGVLVWLGA